MALGLGSIKNMWEMQKQAKTMQKQMKEVAIEGSSKDAKVTIKIDGTQEIQDMMIADELLNPQMKDILVKDIKEALKKAQEALQAHMVKNMDMDQLKSMLSGMGG
jgi:DNA-binding protein YbaB